MNKNTNTTERTNTFEQVLREYEQQARTRTPKTEAEYTTALYNLAKCCLLAVMKKCINTATPTDEDKARKATRDNGKRIAQIRAEFLRDMASFKNMAYISANAYEGQYTPSGKYTTAILDKELAQAEDKMMEERLGEGMSLLHDAIVRILEEDRKARERNNGHLPEGYLEQVYTMHTLKKRVYIKLEDTANGWEDRESTAIQEIYKAIRREIANNNTITNNGKCSYAEDIATDGNITATIYRRNKYGVNDIAILEGLDLSEIAKREQWTERQTAIIELRLQGAGYSAISTYLGISEGGVYNHLQRIAKKWYENGNKTPKAYIDKVQNGNK